MKITSVLPSVANLLSSPYREIHIPSEPHRRETEVPLQIVMQMQQDGDLTKKKS